MDHETLRAWWWTRQGLDGSLEGISPARVLARAGWARSVGGDNPYLALFARARCSRKDADQAVADLQIHELPAARGCTYVLPRSDFALGLKVGQPFAGVSDLATALKLGASLDELEHLKKRVVEVLAGGPLDPAGLKDALGDSVRNLGEEGKKKGLTTTLPLALGLLQAEGQIRRMPVNGRLDQQRYAYALWSENPLDGFSMSIEEAHTELARKFFGWIGPASIVHFQTFAAIGAGKAKAAVEPLRLVPIEAGSDLLLLPEDRDELLSFRAPKEPQYRLVAGLDSLLLQRRDIGLHIDPADAGRKVPGEKKMIEVGQVQDLTHHAILDRGRLIGLWEFDKFRGDIAWQSWIPVDDALKAEVARVETFVRDELGDARSFSLDSPESRKPKIEALRQPIPA